jgi:hypothetical protein
LSRAVTGRVDRWASAAAGKTSRLAAST